MNTFISDTLNSILKTAYKFDDVVFVLPSQRAGVYVKNELKKKIQNGFLPEVLSIETFIEKISGLKKVDTVELLFLFYEIYKDLENDPHLFDTFSSWATTALQDYNEIDQYLVPQKEIFTYLKDVERLKKWTLEEQIPPTQMMKNHLSFMELFGDLYQLLYKKLTAKQIGYQGLLYRESTKRVSDFIKRNSEKQFLFIGFNALNKAEETLFQKFLERENTQVFWDIDSYFLEKNYLAAKFIKKYLETWPYYKQNSKPNFPEYFKKQKNIEVIGTSKQVMQQKIAGNILLNSKNVENTAWVLADEKSLPVTLNSIPQNVNNVNITMGYPLQEIPNAHFISSFFQLFITQKKLQKTEHNLYYHKDVLNFIKDPFFTKLLAQDSQNYIEKIENNIHHHNKTFVEVELLQIENEDGLKELLKPLSNVDDFIARIITLLEKLLPLVEGLEREYVYRFHNSFLQLQTLQKNYNYLLDINSLFKFYKLIVGKEMLSFKGEPLRGLQIMGMLETRVLDFENLIITSVNEGVLPASSKQSSFIPFDVKLLFDLPTYKDKDAIYSYHFFRLIQRAKNVSLIYNTDMDSFGKGEVSRFISQLELMREDIQFKTFNLQPQTSSKEYLSITKNEEISEKLRQLAVQGFSPSVITNYLYNPIEFYQQKVLEINELDSLEENIADNTLGTIVHNVLESLYTPFIGKNLTISDIDLLRNKVSIETELQFKKELKSSDYQSGKNKLYFEVAKQYVKNMLLTDKELLQKNNTLQIISLEKLYSTEISVDGISFPIKLKGFIDRVDLLNDTLRIIDYKSGKVEAKNLLYSIEMGLNDFKFHKALQVVWYAYLFTKNHKISRNLIGGIYSFKNTKGGFLQVNFGTSWKTDNQITPEKLKLFENHLSEILLEIYNQKIALTEKEPIF